MKVVLDIKSSKAPFVLELLGYFSFVKVQPITNEKALLVKASTFYSCCRIFLAYAAEFVSPNKHINKISRSAGKTQAKF